LVKGSDMFNRVQKSVDRVNLILQENIAGMRIIKAFGRRTHENDRFSQSNRALKHETETAFRFVESSMPVLLFVMNASLLFILWFGNAQTIAGTTNVGDVVAIVNYALRTVMAISMFTFIALAFSRAKASADRLETILIEKVPHKEIETSKENIRHGEIVFDNVTFSYPYERKLILKNISFSVCPGEQLAVIGATGAGKTSLFQLIPRLYEPDEGVIYLDDRPLVSYDLRILRNSVGYVPQSPLLFTGTIKENIAFGKEDAEENEVIQAA